MATESENIQTLARQLGEQATHAGAMLAVAESCTGGWLAKVITDIPGSSAWFDRGFVTYTNEAKQDMLGVSNEVLATHGAVSEETVAQMAQGALQHSRAQLTVAISGIAGPGGGSVDKPVGTVCFGWATPDAMQTETQCFSGDRAAVREQAVSHALQGLLARLEE